MKNNSSVRLVTVAALIASLPLSALAAPTWQTISAEQGKRIELERTSIKRAENGKVTVIGRIVFEHGIPDVKSGGTFHVIEATTVYDCASRHAATLKRVFKKNETELLREEEEKAVDLPVRRGTVDDKILLEVCRPTKDSPKDALKDTLQKANDAGAQLKKGNEALLKSEMAKAENTKPAFLKPIVIKPELPKIDPAKAELSKAEAVKSEPPKSNANAGQTEIAPQKIAEAAPPAMKFAPHATPEPSMKKPVAAARHAKLIPVPEKHATTAVPVAWSYDGAGRPENWAKLDPQNHLCANGQRQSPIDIRDGIKVDLEPIQFDYRPSAFSIIDSGRTVQVTVQSSGRITIMGKTYALTQVHFHNPAEEKINGRSFNMAAHLVHRSEDGKLAMIAIMLEKGAENPFIQTLWNNLPLDKNQEEFSPPTANIDLNAFLPANRDYYAYMGSLTTPPCTEGVLWLVMRQPVQISQDQIDIFSHLYRNNARPIQASWGRLIKEGR